MKSVKHNLNVEKLKGVLSYFSYLYKSGEINDKILEVLIKYACSIYIENEIEIRIEETLEAKLLQFIKSNSPLTGEVKSRETAIQSLEIDRLIGIK